MWTNKWARYCQQLTLLCAVLVLSVASAARSHHSHHHRPSSEFVKGKICIGTNGRMSVPSNRENHYRNLRDRFTNCTYVDGNLELTWLQNDSLDLSFLQYIREVTGYVLISHVDVRRIVLPRLQIIRGRTLFKLNVRDEEFALIVTLSNAYTLELPALRDVLSGSVGIYKNYNLCHVRTINWDEIITGQKAQYIYVYNFTSPERECPSCDKNCEAGCWGEGAENCQKFSKTNCSPQCWQGRCYGSNPRDCCHLFCAGGCKGPKQSDCIACRNFYDDGMCTQECPPMQHYNPTTYSWEPNPKGKYAYGATCVRNCPEHLLKDNGACVRSCPPKKTAVNGECIPCNVTCPKTCTAENPIHAGNIESLKDCTVIDGYIEILEQSFNGFQQIYSNFSFGPRYPKMHPDRLEVFSTLTEVTEFINIQGSHEKFTNLSYFRNLKVIGGRKKVENYFASLYIVKTALKSLELKSLKKINSGAVVIVENEKLCFAPQISWRKIQKSSENQNIIENNKSEAECKAENLVCDAQCSSEGCWGAGPDQCLSCANYQFGDKCVENCNVYTGMYKAGPKICKACHPECHSTCIGPGPEHCTRCKNARDGPFCVSKCPETKYQSENGTCAACHSNCVKGCTGPLNTVGLNGCKACSKAIISIDVTVERCIHKNESCPDGYYHDYLGPAEEGSFKALIDTILCRKCHPRCKKCTGYGIHQQVCRECTKYKKGEQCEDECSSDHYVDTDNTCQKCNKECTSCVGPTSSDCLKCAHFKIFLDGQPTASNSSAFNCTSTCPSEVQHIIFPNDQSIDPYCFSEPLGPKYTGQAKTSIILVAVLTVAVLLLIILAVIVYICRQKAKAKKEAVKMTMVLTGCEDNEPLRPTNVKPNLAKLRIVKEAELRKGGILGYGAFGKVFKGVWVPEGENVKIPVAIKVLRESSGANTSKEFLEEAYIMASVEHPNLLQLLAVCMTSQMMLITQLMPLGCLLDYVRNHKEKIGSKALLNWCTQIGRGMAYLEEKRLVHRDLAARNVLVQTPNCVKITDFGLAKLLDINEDEYKAAGGKMPIKWLALECIQHRIFTHKSDVWAFGVTIWELLTYGGRPYENISARNVPELIENGLKLPQPNICTLDIYCIMVSCWMLDADSRPTFKQLADTFAEMARDPGRYLVIPGDKFMRLPSYSHQDEKELIRNLSSAMEGPESLMEADEYLQPKFRAAVATTPVSSSGASTGLDGQSSSIKPSSSSWQNTGTGPESVTSEPARSETWDQELLRYAHTGFDVSNLRQYCNAGIGQSDRSDVPSEQSFDTMSKIKEAQVGNLKLDLPLDEDDYLMPTPQQNQAASTYMDLIGEGNQESEEKVQDFGYPGFVGMRSGKTCIDNPEYLMSIPEEESISAQTLGIPTVTETVENNRQGEEHESSSISRPGNTNFAPQKSVEEESMSDHEYYNDLQRELQPLRRNETTV